MADSNLKEVVSRMQRVSRRLVDVRRDVGALTREVQTLLDELDRLMPGLTAPDGASGVQHGHIEKFRLALDPKEYPSGKVYTNDSTHKYSSVIPDLDPYGDTRGDPITDTSDVFYIGDLWTTDSRGDGE